MARLWWGEELQGWLLRVVRSFLHVHQRQSPAPKTDVLLGKAGHIRNCDNASVRIDLRRKKSCYYGDVIAARKQSGVNM